MVDALVLINSTLVFLYGYFLSISFAGGWKTKKERRIIGVLCVVIWCVQVLCWKIFGFTATWRLYPLISHVLLSV